MSKKKTSRNLARRLAVEQFEPRCLLSADTVSFFGYGALSASFPPDGTQIGTHQNNLNETFDQAFGQGKWQEVIEEALQTWAREADINAGLVADDGSPAGVYGPLRGDERFGDIRLFAIPMGDDIWAEAVSENSSTAGTWSGDMIFNSNAKWRGLDDLRTVALHEFGHIFGLEHSSDPKSPMYVHGPSSNNEPTADDLLMLRQLHGARPIDSNESDKSNDKLKQAFRIRGNEELAQEDFNGSQVWIQFGDLHSENDVDYYRIDTALNYSGPVAIEVSTRELSSAHLDVAIVDEKERELTKASLNSLFGSAEVMQVDAVTPGTKLYLRVRSGDSPMWAQGHYAITVAHPETLAKEQVEIQSYIHTVHRWYFDSKGAKRGFSYHLLATGQDGYGDDDQHADDKGGGAANDMAIAVLGSNHTVYTAVGSITDTTDVDTFRFRTSKNLAAGVKLLVNVETLDYGTLVPEVTVWDHKGAQISGEFQSVGFGVTQLLIPSASADTEYVIKVQASSVSSQFRIGNYSLEAQVSTLVEANTEYMSGNLDTASSTLESTLYVAIPQILTFSLSGSSLATQSDMQLLFRLFDQKMQLVTSIAAPVGKMRSLPGVFVEAGEYYLQVSRLTSNSALPQVAVRLTGTQAADTIGPLIAPVDSEPLYVCDEGTDFCYPDGTQTTDPIATDPTVSVPLPPPPLAPLPLPPDEFFWDPLISPTNVARPLDVNNDAVITPMDALIVINYLNSHPAGTYPDQFVGFLDTNADSFITPIDALLVINLLNKPA